MIIKTPEQYYMLCKGLASPLISLYFSREMGDRCNYLLICVRTYMEIHYIREKLSVYNFNELASQYLV